MSEEMRRTQGGEGEPRTPRKSATRRKRRRGMGPGGAILYAVFVIGISTLLAAVGWVAANDVLALNKPDQSAVITIAEGEQFGDVVDDLKGKGLIEFKFVFRLYAMFSNADDKLAPGTYELSTDMDYRAIVANMGARSASRLTATVTIPEGYTVEQTFALLETKGVSAEARLKEMAAEHDYNFSFLEGRPLGDYRRLEGYLFPDTYEFYLGEDPKTILNKMLLNFDRRLTDELRAQAAEDDGNLHDVIIVASMIEKETDGTDQAKIASVIYNRLNNPDRGTNGFLQIDATIQYVLPQRKEKLSVADTQIDSPYNTYQHPGLPAGPIANPGMAAIYAALNPESTKYYYYALGDDGVHHFFETYDRMTAFTKTQELYQNG